MLLVFVAGWVVHIILLTLWFAGMAIGQAILFQLYTCILGATLVLPAVARALVSWYAALPCGQVEADVKRASWCTPQPGHAQSRVLM